MRGGLIAADRIAQSEVAKKSILLFMNCGSKFTVALTPITRLGENTQMARETFDPRSWRPPDERSGWSEWQSQGSSF